MALVCIFGIRFKLRVWIFQVVGVFFSDFPAKFVRLVCPMHAACPPIHYPIFDDEWLSWISGCTLSCSILFVCGKVQAVSPPLFTNSRSLCPSGLRPHFSYPYKKRGKINFLFYKTGLQILKRMVADILIRALIFCHARPGAYVLSREESLCNQFLFQKI